MLILLTWRLIRVSCPLPQIFAVPFECSSNFPTFFFFVVRGSLQDVQNIKCVIHRVRQPKGFNHTSAWWSRLPTRLYWEDCEPVLQTCTSSMSHQGTVTDKLPTLSGPGPILSLDRCLINCLTCPSCSIRPSGFL